MPTNINPSDLPSAAHISPSLVKVPKIESKGDLKISQAFKDPSREAEFSRQYSIPAHITFTNVNDKNGDWIEVTARFQSPKNNHYVLVEYFKDGKDNSTDYVVLCYTRNNEKIERIFKKHKDAELALVALMEEE